jgi:hypothetical protein
MQARTNTYERMFKLYCFAWELAAAKKKRECLNSLKVLPHTEGKLRTYFIHKKK